MNGICGMRVFMKTDWISSGGKNCVLDFTWPNFYFSLSHCGVEWIQVSLKWAKFSFSNSCSVKFTFVKAHHHIPSFFSLPTEETLHLLSEYNQRHVQHNIDIMMIFTMNSCVSILILRNDAFILNETNKTCYLSSEHSDIKKTILT